MRQIHRKRLVKSCGDKRGNILLVDDVPDWKFPVDSLDKPVQLQDLLRSTLAAKQYGLLVADTLEKTLDYLANAKKNWIRLVLLDANLSSKNRFLKPRRAR